MANSRNEQIRKKKIKSRSRNVLPQSRNNIWHLIAKYCTNRNFSFALFRLHTLFALVFIVTKTNTPTVQVDHTPPTLELAPPPQAHPPPCKSRSIVSRHTEKSPDQIFGPNIGAVNRRYNTETC